MMEEDTAKDNLRIWIGLLHVLPRDGELIFGHGIGAYCHVLALANGEIEFRQSVEKAVDYVGCDLESIQDVEEFDDQHYKDIENSDIWEIAQELSLDEPLLFDVLQTYVSEEEYTTH